MTDERILELMHGEVDGVNSPSETARLHAYLAVHPEAQKEFDELLQLSALLQNVEPLDPPPNLRKNILNAVSLKLSESPHRRRGLSKAFLSFFTSPKVKYAYAFSAGLAIGVILLMFWERTGSAVDTAHLYGTIMPDVAAETYHSAGVLDVHAGSVDGTLKLSYSDRGALAHLELRMDQKAEVVLSYDSQALQFTGIRQLTPSSGGLNVEDGSVRILLSGQNQSLIAFYRLSTSLPPVRLRIVQSGTLVYEGSAPFVTAGR